MLGTTESENLNFAGVGVHRIPGKKMDGSQLSLFYNNIGNIGRERQRDIQNHLKDKFDPLYGQNRQSCGRFPRFIISTEPKQGSQDPVSASSSIKSSSQNECSKAPHVAYMKPSLSDSSPMGFSDMPHAHLATSISGPTSGSNIPQPSLLTPFTRQSGSDSKALTDSTPPIQVHDLGTPHLSSSSPGTNRASPTSLLTVPPNFDTHRSSGSFRKDDTLFSTDTQTLQQLGPYRQSGLEALDMAFWNSGAFYSDDESDLEYQERRTCTLPSDSHAPLSQSEDQVESGYQYVSFPSKTRETASDTSKTDPNTLGDYLNDTLIDDYLNSSFDADDPPVSRSSYLSSGSSYDDEAWLSANRRKSQVVSTTLHGLVNPKLTTWEPLRTKEALPSLPKKIDGEPECRRCHRKILGKVVRSANGLFSGLYHRECLRCVDCDTNLFRTDIFVLNDQTYCDTDFHLRNGSTCKKCGTGIDGIYRLAWNNMCYHTNCFVCAFNDPSSGSCRAELDEYYMIHEKPYCEEHARRVIKQLYIRGRKL